MNLLRLFEFYLMAMFVVGTSRRFGLYQSFVRVALALTRRYQKLFGIVREQSDVLFTWSTLAPALLTLLLWGVQSALTRLIFPHAVLTWSEAVSRWGFIPLLAVPVISMVGLDIYFLVCVGKIDPNETEKYFQQAESWIGTWKASAVRMATLGWMNPQKMVDEEVRKAMHTGREMILVMLWWTVVQTALRVATGLALWTVWTVGPA